MKEFKKNHGREFRLNRKRVAIITYTNAASNEIKDRLDFDSIFSVSTIHSFAWELIEPFVKDIKIWLASNLENEILKLEDEQSRSRDLKNKTSIDRARKIESKNKRISNLENITKFTYNPNGDNITKDSLNHSEVISIAAYFIHYKALMQELLVCKYPILLIDESQYTKKELIDAFFELQKNKNNIFSLGLFGDTMQRIYFDGKEKLEPIEGNPPDLANLTGGCNFHDRCPYRQSICSEQKPELVEFDPGHQVACHFTGQLKAPDFGGGKNE